MAFGSSIDGWRYCRPNIAVDGTFLKSKYCGTLLSASTLDGNNQIFPLAFGIVDSENDISWTWFFKKIQECYGCRDGLVIVSDRHLSISKAVSSVFSNVEYCVCIQHLFKNLRLSFKASLIEKHFFNCAKSYTVDEFEYSMRLMESVCPTIRQYLTKAGFEKWSRAYARGRRYDMMTTNCAESINSLLKDPRNLPVASLLEAIRELLQKRFYERSKLAMSIKSILTPWAENRLREQHEKSRSFVV